MKFREGLLPALLDTDPLWRVAYVQEEDDGEGGVCEHSPMRARAGGAFL